MTKITFEETMWNSWEEFRNDLENNYIALVNRPKSEMCSGNCFEEDNNGNMVKKCALCIQTPWGLDCKLNNL